MNFIEELGTMALGSRIKNLSELLMKDASNIYKDQDIDFEPRWFTLFQLLLRRKEIQVTEISRELNQTHPAAVQVVNSLENKRLIATRKDKTDQRKRMVRLTRRGRYLAEELAPVWEAIHQAAEEILSESEPALLEYVARIENTIRQKSTYQRVRERLIENTLNEIEFVSYDERYRKDFRELNEDWLNAYLEISPHDHNVLSDPMNAIINKNGRIYLMVSRNEVIGTYALQQINAQQCELSKFTIKKKYRGWKLGARMMRHIIQEAKSMGCHSILLFTHHKLTDATQLYHKTGFKEIEGHPDLKDQSGRCSMAMQLIINQ